MVYICITKELEKYHSMIEKYCLKNVIFFQTILKLFCQQQKEIFFLCFGIRNFIVLWIIIFWLGGKICIVKIERWFIFPESRYVNSNPVDGGEGQVKFLQVLQLICFFFLCHAIFILSWTSTNLEFSFATLVYGENHNLFQSATSKCFQFDKIK